jgi:hypothetical protein
MFAFDLEKKWSSLLFDLLKRVSTLHTVIHLFPPEKKKSLKFRQKHKKDVHFLHVRRTTAAFYPKAIKIKSNTMTTNVVAAPLTSPVVEEDSPASYHHNGSTNALQSIHQARSSFLSLAATRVSNNTHTDSPDLSTTHSDSALRNHHFGNAHRHLCSAQRLHIYHKS